MPDPSATPPTPPPSPRKPPLKVFGGYEIEGELGRGGMGVVYLARQIELNRRVALKMLTGHYGPAELQRFLEEAETAAGLNHTNIAHIYEVGEHEGAPFFSMEYVEAGSLADRLRKDLPSPRDAAELLMNVARALHFAHQNGVVHRDMKPATILPASPRSPTSELQNALKMTLNLRVQAWCSERRLTWRRSKQRGTAGTSGRRRTSIRLIETEKALTTSDLLKYAATCPALVGKSHRDAHRSQYDGAPGWSSSQGRFGRARA